jgi:hypothetical protein
MKTKTDTKAGANDFGPRRTWDDYGTIQNSIIGLDAFVAGLEREWGVGRLRLLAPDDLRARFDRQCQKLDEAVWSEKPAAEVVGQIDAMRRGFPPVRTARAFALRNCYPLTPDTGAAPKTTARRKRRCSLGTALLISQTALASL